MKKFYFSLIALAFVLHACDKEEIDTQEVQIDNQDLQIDMSDFYVYTDTNEATRSAVNGKNQGKNCYTMVNLNRLLKEDPDLERRMYDIEYNTRKFIAENYKPGNGNGGGNGGGGNGGGDDTGGGGGGTGDTITPYQDFAGSNTIPVVFHVIYNTSSQNIPDSQLQAQIDALNRDFNANNPNSNSIPGVFKTLEANLGVNFVTAGILRVKSRKKSWRPDDSMKFTSSGGSDVVDPLHYLNVWIVNNMPYMGGNILGYAQFPGGNWATDGIVLDHRFVGNTQYSTGQTATHEIGHWMNLRHIWGDGPCGADDFVSDTPLADGYNTGCPSFPGPNGCGEDEMFMNYMDYTNDTCMSLFTNGQKLRMAAQFTEGNFRADMGILIN